MTNSYEPRRPGAGDPEVFGYRHPGLRFQEVIRIEESGLLYRGRHIPWTEIRAMRAYPNFFGDTARASLRIPSAALTLYVLDGSVLTIRGDQLTKPGEGRHPLSLRTGLPKPYMELVQRLREHGIADWQGPKEELILVGTCQVMGVVGFLAGHALGPWLGNYIPLDRIAWAVVTAVVAAALGLLIAPVLGRLFRKPFLVRN